MRKIISLLSSILLVLALTSCSSVDIGTEEKIVPPSNNLIPLKGEWKIQDYKHGNFNSLSDDEAANWIGREAVFDEDIAAVGDEYCLSPNYKIKNVDSRDYLLYQYKINPDYLGIEDSRIQVVTVSSERQFFYEFIKIDDSKIIANIGGTFFYLNKVSDTVSQTYSNADMAEVKNNGNEYISTLKSGLLLGLRSAKKTSSDAPYILWEYRTLYISLDNKISCEIYEMPDLFVPRMSGFWKLKVNRNVYENAIVENLFAYPAEREILKAEYSDKDELDTKTNKTRTILYVGNDYVSIELSSGITGSNSTSILQVLPIDNIETARAVKISDIAGQEGISALNNSASEYIYSNPSSDKNMFDNLNEQSFTVSRRNGHWIMKGRLNYSDNSFIDFNIKAIPPKKLVSYDELCISWNSIKNKIPDAVDAYTSPNRDMAVILTGNSILIHSIENNTLSKEPLSSIELRQNESVVMAEWAQGGYTEKWKKDFAKNGGLEIKE